MKMKAYSSLSAASTDPAVTIARQDIRAHIATAAAPTAATAGSQAQIIK